MLQKRVLLTELLTCLSLFNYCLGTFMFYLCLQEGIIMHRKSFNSTHVYACMAVKPEASSRYRAFDLVRDLLGMDWFFPRSINKLG